MRRRLPWILLGALLLTLSAAAFLLATYWALVKERNPQEKPSAKADAKADQAQQNGNKFADHGFPQNGRTASAICWP